MAPLAAAASKLNHAFWSGRRVALTGATGFIGGWLALWLTHLGAKVYGMGLPPTTPSLYAAIDLSSIVPTTIFDINDAALLRRWLQDAQPEVILHFAAQPLVRLAYHDPITTWRDNVLGTVQLLEAARACPTPPAIIVMTSDKVYLNDDSGQAFTETSPLGGFEPYGASKAATEMVIESYRHSYFNGQHLASVRAGNVIGGGDFAAERLVPDAIKAFSTNQPLVLRRPHATRPWQYVLDPVWGIIQLAEKLYTDRKTFSRGWNLAPNTTQVLRVETVATMLAAAWGEGAQVVSRPDTSIYEANCLAVDATAAQQQLGWRPRWDYHTSIQKTAAWYKNFYTGNAMRAASVGEIEAYQHA